MNSNSDEQIATEREAIDTIDLQMARLLAERCQHVKRVGQIKSRTLSEGTAFIRPAREALMVRNAYTHFRQHPFPALAAAQLWRLIIAASLTLESPLTITAFAREHDQELYWLAREYFGGFVPVMTQPTARRVLSDLIEQKAVVGVLPLPEHTAEGQWWLKLPDDIKIFACAPFILTPSLGFNTQPRCLLAARLTAEATGDDVSLISIETAQDVSQSRIKTICDGHQLAVRWLAAENFPSGHKVHLVEIKGFISPTSSETFYEELRHLSLAVRWLGSYAAPLTVTG